MKALFSLRSILQFLAFIVAMVAVKVIAGEMGYDISGVLDLFIVFGGSTLVWWTIAAAKANKPDDSET